MTELLQQHRCCDGIPALRRVLRFCVLQRQCSRLSLRTEIWTKRVIQRLFPREVPVVTSAEQFQEEQRRDIQAAETCGSSKC